MPNLNRVLLMGNLTRDPEMRFLPSNMAVVNIGLAINRRWRNQQGEQQEEVTFIDCEAFGKTAEAINSYLKKGRPIFIEGRLKLDSWQDKEGNNRSKMKVVVENFQFVDSKPGSGGGGGGDPDMSDSAPRSSRPPARTAGAPAQRPAAGAPGPGAPAHNPAASGGAEPHQPVDEDDIPF